MRMRFGVDILVVGWMCRVVMVGLVKVGWSDDLGVTVLEYVYDWKIADAGSQRSIDRLLSYSIDI